MEADLSPLELVREAILEHRAALPAVSVALSDALGAVLANDVVATESVPRFPNSAMDGFALRAADTDAAPVALAVVGATMAGEAAGRPLGPGETLRIMTGAPLPPGADAVLTLEEAEFDDDTTLRVRRRLAPGKNVRYPGEDVQAGSRVFGAGTELGPAHLGALAALGERSVAVHQRPRVGVLSLGDELVAAAGPLREGQIRDANRPLLLGLVARSGGVPVDLGVVGDDADALLAAFEDGLASCDALVSSGGASFGDRDLVQRVLDKLAGTGRVRSFALAIRPAKPFVFAEVGPRRVPVFGLPGNPVSALVAFELLARPALRKMAGHRQLVRPAIAARAAAPFPRRADGKVHYARANASLDEDGRLVVRPAVGQGSHMLTAAAQANALAVLPDGDGVDAGDLVRLLLVEVDGLDPAV